MAEAIDLETRQWAAQLWIEEGRTYESVSAITGVSVGALKKWAAEEGWPERRGELRQSLRDIRRDQMKLRSALLKNALTSLNPQDVFAVTSLEGMLARAQGKAGDAGAAAPIAPENLHEIKTPQQAIDAMQDAIERKLNGMLAGGDISLQGIRDMKQAMELLEKMKVQYAPAEASGEGKQRGLSEEAAEDIRKKILGL